MTDSQKKPVRRPRPEERWPEILPYAFLSLGSFVAGLLLILLLLMNARRLVSLGLEGRFYFLALLPLALSVSAFLFGALRSSAIYIGKQVGGDLELRGAVAGFFIVMVLGLWIPRATHFPLTVYVHGQRGVHDLVLRKQGLVVLDLGGDRRAKPIGENGDAIFPAIEAIYSGQLVHVFLEADDYELIDSRPRELEGESLYLEVQRKEAHVSGRAQDTQGEPIAGAAVNIKNMTTTTGASGHFEIAIPRTMTDPEFTLQVTMTGYEAHREIVVPYGGEIVVILKKRETK